jgi:alkanesulfonate monooxygenase SsuD/methylene tetrahydromethanopterin reductase-like flavin-dependent oxidoreductase (luciferase family)
VNYDLDLDSGVVYPGLTMVDLAKAAEDAGFDAIWKGESNSADPMVCLSAMATGTKRIKLGTAVYHVFGRSPITLGIQAATLNDLSGGRVLVGLGVSNKTIAAWHGDTFDRPIRRLREYAEIVRLAASGERVEFHGDAYSPSPFKLSWRPSYPHLTLFFAGLGEQMTRLAGRYADGIMVNMANPQMLRDIFSRVRQAAAEAGRDPESIEYVAKVRVSLSDDLETARASSRARWPSITSRTTTRT